VELYFTDTPSAKEQQHLGHCHDCDGRRASMAHLLDETAQASAEDVEAAFPAERLARQQLQILERVEAVAGPARVIAFPAVPASAPGVISRSRPTTRWIAAAAVAGLVIGIVAGRAGRDPGQAGRDGRATLVQARQDAGQGIRTVSTPLSDDQLLIEIESAIESRSGGALHALDALTPRAGEF
jgi:hypothetical protein